MSLKFFFSFLIIFSLFSSLVLAIGISPPRHVVKFTPGFSGSFSHEIVNTRSEKIEVLINASGELAQYIVFDQKNFIVEPNAKKKFTYTLNLPDKLSPGNKTTFIEVLDNTKRGGGMFKIAVGVKGRVIVMVPVPGKYAEVDLAVPHISEGDVIYYNARIENFGSENLNDIDLIIEFRDNSGNVVKKFNHNNLVVKSQDYMLINDFFESSDFSSGEYSVYARIDYGNSITDYDVYENVFYVGGYYVELINHTNVLFAGQITPFTANVRSMWNGVIESVYYDLEINGKTYKSVATDLGAFEIAQLNTYVDDLSFELDSTYDAKLTLHYSDQSIDESFELATVENILPDRSKRNFEFNSDIFLDNLPYIAIGASILLIIINVLVFTKSFRKK